MKKLVLVGLVSLIGCGGGGGNSSPDAASIDAIGVDGAPAGSSFDTAIPISLGQTSGALPTAGATEYYKVTLSAGDRLVIATSTNAATVTDGSVVDTFVTMFDSAHTQIAQDDDAWPRFDTDSQLFFQAPAAGDYYLTIEDCRTALGASSCYTTPLTDLAYTLNVVTVPTNLEVNAGAAQDGTITNAQAIPWVLAPGGTAGQYGISIADGTLRTTTDTHVFAVNPPANTNVAANERARADFFLQPIGSTNGDGSTANVKMWVTDSTGNLVLASADQSNYLDGDNPGNGPLDLSLPITPGGHYFLFVQNTATTSQPATDYYFVEAFVGSFDYGQIEAEGSGTLVNDTQQTAQTVVPPSGHPDVFAVDGDLSPPTDVDYYLVTPPSGITSAYLQCASARAGSGVQGLTARLEDGTGTMLGTIGPETATADLGINLTSFPVGTTYLKVTATGQDTTNTGISYRCFVFYQ